MIDSILFLILYWTNEYMPSFNIVQNIFIVKTHQVIFKKKNLSFLRKPSLYVMI